MLKFLTLLFFIVITNTIFTFSAQAVDVCNCRGNDGPGGPCYSGAGGPAYAGPGGPAYSGVGGPCYAGIGGPEYSGVGGPCYSGPGAMGANCPSICP